ncbi:hypothetical protein BH20ACT15_BH20ACT15_14610 [soil metagenome]
MPTKRPRHMVTETPPVEEALAELRKALGSERVDFAELVIVGARVKARELRGDGVAGRRARSRLAESVRARSIPIDVEAADEVKRLRLPGSE